MANVYPSFFGIRGLCLALCLALAAPGALRAETVVPASRADLQYSFASVVKRAAPAVVNIYTRKVIRQRGLSPFMGDPFFQYFFGGSGFQGPGRQRLENSLGSGVLVRPDGLVVTSNHVIDGADEITVVLSDRREFDAHLVLADAKSDLAVLRIEAKGETLPYLEIRDSDTLEVGDLVLAIGDPFGVGQSVTSGIISALARTGTDARDSSYFIQTDAAINPGNSGGALVTMDGRLVGINAAIYSRDGGNMGIGFAVPSNMARAVMASVETGKKTLARPWVGLGGQSVTSDLAKSLGLDRPRGFLVNRLPAASPAAKAGVKVGDVVVSVNGVAVDDLAAFNYRVDTLPMGSAVELGLARSGKPMTVTFALTPPPETTPREATMVRGANPLRGAEIANLSPALAEEAGLDDADEGVVILKAPDTSVAASVGMEAGDIVLSVNGTATPTVASVLEALRARAAVWRIGVRRGDNTVTLVVRG